MLCSSQRLCCGACSGLTHGHDPARHRVLVRFRLQLRLLRFARGRSVGGETWPRGRLAAHLAGRDVGDLAVVLELSGLTAEAVSDPEIKALAKARSEEAVGRGVFGSPWFFVDGEPFWGWDRLPMIDDWLTRGGW